MTSSEKSVLSHRLPGFPREAVARLGEFLRRARRVKGRRVAVFDGDGTTMGQAPHYLADECLYQYAQAHPDWKPEIVRRMTPLANVSIPYVQERVRFFAGLGLQQLRDLGEACFRKYYAGKIFKPMQRLVGLLKRHGFEVWIISASPEALYQQFYARAFGIPITQVIGVKSVVQNGVTTEKIVEPVPQDAGKKLAIETFVQERPLLVAGNSRGDKEMIEHSADLKIIVNPDEFVAPDQKESMADYARRNGWLVLKFRDVPEPGFPAVSSRVFGVRTNPSHQGR